MFPVSQFNGEVLSPGFSPLLNSVADSNIEDMSSTKDVLKSPIY